MSKEMLALMHQVAVEKYAKSPPKKLLMKIMHEIEIKKHYGRHRNWELMVELLARWIVKHQDMVPLTMGMQGFCLNFDGLPLKRDKGLYDHIDKLDLFKHYVVAAKAKPWDYIGEIYNDEGLSRASTGICLTPRGLVDMMVKMLMGDEKDLVDKFEMEKWVAAQTNRYALNYYEHLGQFPRHLPKFPLKPEVQKVLDPCVGTGRFLIEATIMYPKAPMILYGIEIVPSIYRACLVNMAMFSNHPYTIICGDTLRLPQTCNCAHPIWDLGNRWKTPSLQKYYDWRPRVVPVFEQYMQARAKATK